MSNKKSRGLGLSRGLQLGDLLPPLTDLDGNAYPTLPCQTAPAMWDEDATEKDKRHAAQVCRHACPALVACWIRRRQLGRAASGVWGGRVLRKQQDTTEIMVADDALVQWALAAGVTFHPPGG